MVIVKRLHNCARISHLFDANESQSHYIKKKVTRGVSKGRKASSPNHGSIKIALMSSFFSSDIFQAIKQDTVATIICDHYFSDHNNGGKVVLLFRQFAFIVHISRTYSCVQYG